MAKQRNETLEILLREYGFTHQELADEINRVAEQMFNVSVNCTDRHVRRWISGDVRWPWTRYLGALQAIFGRSPEALGFLPRGRSSRVPTPTPRPLPAGREQPVRRREFVAAGLAVTLGLDAIPASGRLGDSDVERIRRIVPALYAHDHALGGGALHRVAAQALARARRALNSCSYGERVGRQLYSAVGDLAATAGWFAYDAGQQEAATTLYGEALQSGILAGDGALQARVWSNLAMQARLLGRDREALRIGQAAVETRQAKGDLWLLAVLHCRQAVGHGRLGDRAGAERSLARAETAFGKANGEAAAWLSFLTAAEVMGLAGAAYQALGQHRRAAELTAASLGMLEPRYERNRVYYKVQHAEALLGHGEVEQAANVAQQVLATGRRVQSARVSDRIRALRGSLATRCDVPAVREFLDLTMETDL